MTITPFIILLLSILCIMLLLAVNSIAVIGFHYSAQFQKVQGRGINNESKGFLWKVKYYGDSYLSEFWRKPFYSCMRCMPSVHGLYVFIPAVLFGFPLWVLAFYPVYVLMLSGLMILIESKFSI